jgi:hypothetical protein
LRRDRSCFCLMFEVRISPFDEGVDEEGMPLPYCCCCVVCTVLYLFIVFC